MGCDDKVECLLLVDNVSKNYNGSPVLSDINLVIQAGEICTMVGPSGCGKSTLLRLILGQERPSSGHILVGGKLVGPPDRDRGIVYQKYSLFPHLNVVENVLVGLKYSLGWWQRARRKKELEREAFKYLERVQLSDHIKKHPSELSGGMLQRAALAQSLVMKPKILLMDEPFGALDPGSREDMQSFLLELWRQYDMTILFVTHDLEEAVFLGTRIIVLSPLDSNGNEFCMNSRQGSTIVADFSIEKKSVSTEIKETARFGEIIQEIRRMGFYGPCRQSSDGELYSKLVNRVAVYRLPLK